MNHADERTPNHETNHDACLRTPANENPWYCLATVLGEQPDDDFDLSLAAKNADVWNSWYSGQADPVELQVLFKRRTGGRVHLPDPGRCPDFSNVEFERRVVCSRFHFNRATNFCNVIFHQAAWFQSAQSESEMDFSFSTFVNGADFSGVDFRGLLGPKFCSAKFLQGTDFSASQLTHADFSKATFADYVLFSSVQFHGVPSFAEASFQGGAGFSSTTFHGPASFSGVSIFGLINFEGAAFKKFVQFDCATFHGRAAFDNVRFGGRTVFAAATFQNFVPDFRGATMHEATEWHGAVWPKSPSKEDAQEYVYAYERLKQEMERLKKYEDELHFFRKELRARRSLLSKRSGGWLLDFAYEATSDYGNNVLRPVLWLIALLATGGALIFRSASSCPKPMSVELAVRLSFANIFVFLPDKRELSGLLDLSCLGTSLQIVSAVQALFGSILLFLIGLAVRNRLRMK